MDALETLHLVNGDAAADLLRAGGVPDEAIVVLREALVAGPAPDAGDLGELVELRAGHLADWYGADRDQVQAELSAAWSRLTSHSTGIVIHLDEERCLDCAMVALCALDALTRAGRAMARSATGIRLARGEREPTAALAPADVAAGAGAWRLIARGDVPGLRIAAFDLDERGGIPGIDDLGELLRLRADDLDGRGLLAGVLALREEIGSHVGFPQLYRQWRAERDPGYGAGDATVARMLELHDA